MKNLLYVGNQLSKHGYTPTTIETLGPLLEKHYIVWCTSDKRNQLMRFFDMSATLLYKRSQVDYLIIDTYGSFYFYGVFLLSQLARLFKIPYLLILHGGNLPVRLIKNPTLCRLVFKYAYQNIAPSGYIQAAFAKHGYDTIVIPNSIPVKEYNFKVRTAFAPKLLWVRSFEQTYNPLLALRVLKNLLGKYPEAQLCMVGPDKDGSLERCQDLAKEWGMEEKVRFTGRLSKQEWHWLSVDYDLFINTTNADNTPVSVIEAMALGLPVVSTNVGGLPFLLNDQEDALLVPAEDETAMVTAIESLLCDTDFAKRLAWRARQKVEHFDSEQVLARWVQLLGR